MGLCGSALTDEERMAIGTSQEWDETLKGDCKEDEKVVKLLLLGTGESGKSTIFKQMQILYDDGFGELEKSSFRHVLRRNVVDTLQALLYGVKHFPELSIKDPKAQQKADEIMQLDALEGDFWNPRIMECVSVLWADPAIQAVYKRRAKLQILDSAAYLFDKKNIERIGADDYMPTQEDILRARLRTSGIVEKKFDIHGVPFRFLDVGGQRNERRKWMHCFEDVRAIIFVVAISEFDQVLYEDENENRLRESVKVFEEIFNHIFFADTAIVLFLNKIDLFEEKLKSGTRLRDYYPDYDGDNSFDNAAKFLEKKFMDVNKAEHTQGKLVFAHLTCATDTQNVERVFDAWRVVILKERLVKLGLT